MMKFFQNRLCLHCVFLNRIIDNQERAKEINDWHTESGVLLLGYEMFRRIVLSKSNELTVSKESLLAADLIVCDEGHRLKQTKGQLKDALREIRTLRRIILTGTPMQNNLREYFEMVNFVKPGSLGTAKDFHDSFEKQITNGQYRNSAVNDVKQMNVHSKVLHRMLNSFVQRFDESFLKSTLPPKNDYVIYLPLTSLMVKMYKVYYIKPIIYFLN